MSQFKKAHQIYDKVVAWQCTGCGAVCYGDEFGNKFINLFWRLEGKARADWEIAWPQLLTASIALKMFLEFRLYLGWVANGYQDSARQPLVMRSIQTPLSLEYQQINIQTKLRLKFKWQKYYNFHIRNRSANAEGHAEVSRGLPVPLLWFHSM